MPLLLLPPPRGLQLLPWCLLPLAPGAGEVSEELGLLAGPRTSAGQAGTAARLLSAGRWHCLDDQHELLDHTWGSQQRYVARV